MKVISSYKIKILKDLIKYKIAYYGEQLKKDLYKLFMDEGISKEINRPPAENSPYYDRAAEKVINNPNEYPGLWVKGGWIPVDILERMMLYITDPNYNKKEKIPVTVAIDRLTDKEAFLNYYKMYTTRNPYGSKISNDILDNINFNKIKESRPQTINSFYKKINENAVAHLIHEGFKNNWNFIFYKKYKKLNPDEKEMFITSPDIGKSMNRNASFILGRPVFVVYRYLQTIDRY